MDNGSNAVFFRANGDDEYCAEKVHQYGTSTGNQRIENWWSHLRKMRTHWWINFFKDMCNSGVLNTSNHLERECLWFCFHAVLNDDLQKVKASLNSHLIRPSRHDSVSGQPDVLFYFPECSGGINNLHRVSEAQIAEMELKVDDENQNYVKDYQQYFDHLMKSEGSQYPTSSEEAFN